MFSRRQIFLNHLAQTTKEPLLLDFIEAEGVYIYDADGKPYIDLISGISVSNIGHKNKKVIQAIKDQAEKHLHLMVYGEYIQAPQTKLAKLITSLLPESLNAVYLLNSGSEANEGALKVAKRYTRRSKMVAFKNSYHGSSHGALSLMSDEYYSGKYKPLLPNVSFGTYNDISSLVTIDHSTACVMIELVQAEAGIYPINKEFLIALRNRCNETGALLIFDEIQTGIGRTGYLYAFEKYGILPDILTTGKAFGAGMPLAAFITSKEIMDTLSEKPILGHITTFGGHPVSCAAAEAGLKDLLDNKYILEVSRKEAFIVEFMSNVPGIISIRNAGLLIGIEFKDQEITFKIIHQCVKQGVIVDWFLYNSKTMRIAPPLTITIEELEKAFRIIKNVILTYCIEK